MSANFKKVGGFTFRSLASDPGDGEAGDIYYNSTFNRFRQFNGVAWSNVGSGSGGGGGGINIIGLDTNFLPNNSDDIDAESTVGNWAAYADAAGTQPVDMTGGSPTTTVTRTTTGGEVLDGQASFKVTKPASNVQGEGVSLLVNVPPGYRGKTHRLFNPIKILSGSLIAGDVLFYFFDVTNSKILNIGGYDILNSLNQLDFKVFIPGNTTQIRIGYHFASTSASALEFSFDDNFLGVGKIFSGPNISDSLLADFTFSAGFGTVTDSDFRFKRVGETMSVVGRFVAGTTAASTAEIILPSGYSIDTSKLSSSSDGQRVGFFNRVSAGAAYADTTGGPYVIFYDGSTPDRLFISQDPTSSALNKGNGNDVAGTGDGIQVNFEIPILGWSAESAASPSGILRMSDILANGTRVTSTPTQLGEYRSYQKDAGAATGSDAAFSTAISSADGIPFGAFNFATGGSGAFNISRLEIFIGFGKSYRIKGYASTGRSGWLVTDFFEEGSAFASGVESDYDESIGVLILNFIRGSSSNTSNAVGEAAPTGGGGLSDPTTGYYDVYVADNDYQIQVSQFNNEMLVSQYFGTGSAALGTTNTVTVRFLTESKIGNAISRTSTAADGDLFTFNEAGLYIVSGTLRGNSGAPAQTAEVVKNPTAGELNGSSNPSPDRLICYNQSVNATSGRWYTPLSGIIRAIPGDTCAVLLQGVSPDGSDVEFFKITKISN